MTENIFPGFPAPGRVGPLSHRPACGGSLSPRREERRPEPSFPAPAASLFFGGHTSPGPGPPQWGID
ncbi:hypothetical protein HMPREF0262_02424 [Clostridium sp. ATCC 29733]|nr:hypothetical protein HMPREF0262_02424 [Clostridium sp. ATCC 29733]